ncbi:MAG: hypothetical protein KUL80_03490 [Comamonas sp.]|nr:hypothetical protein [Comamonas sp.]
MATATTTKKPAKKDPAVKAPAKTKTPVSTGKTTKKVATTADKQTESEPINSEIAVKQAEKATKSKAKPAASTTLAPKAIWPFPIGPKP